MSRDDRGTVTVLGDCACEVLGDGLLDEGWLWLA